MHAYVYKSLKKADTYVFLAGRDEFTRLPAPVRERLGGLQFVLDVELTPGRKLARADAGVVRDNLASRGFHLQMPALDDDPSIHDPMHGDWGTDA